MHVPPQRLPSHRTDRSTRPTPALLPRGATAESLALSVDRAARIARRLLRSHQLDDRFTVTITSRPRGCAGESRLIATIPDATPQISIHEAVAGLLRSAPLPVREQLHVIVDTILHEMGCVLYRRMIARWPGAACLVAVREDQTAHGRSRRDPEEDFARRFAHALSGRIPDTGIDQAIRLLRSSAAAPNVYSDGGRQRRRRAI